MSVVRDHPNNGKPLPGPGVWLGPEPHMFAIVPLHRPGDGLETIPFAWATDYPPVGEFVLRFPAYWRADRVAEVWVGGRNVEGGVYWCRRDNPLPGST